MRAKRTARCAVRPSIGWQSRRLTTGGYRTASRVGGGRVRHGRHGTSAMIYRPLAFSNTRSPAVIPQRATRDLPSLSLDDPAITAMTDFTQECPVTVSPERHIDDALKDMIRAGVRSLLVLEEGRVLGLITSFDIQRERPMLFL